MKYIKLFEDQNEDQYEEISIQSYMDYITYENQLSIERFTEKEFDIISNLIHKISTVKEIKPSIYLNKEGSIICIFGWPSIVYTLGLNKMNDNWYFAHFNYKEKKSPFTCHKYYKCDEFEGLLKCLNTISTLL